MGADLQQIGAERQQQENTVDIARAEAEKTKGLLEVQDQFKNDPDYSTYNKRATVATNDVVSKAANLIRDPQMRARWSIGAGTDAFRVTNGINDHGVTVQREAETVAFDNALETNRRLYVDPNTPPDVRAKAKADIAGAIEQGQKSGLLDPSQAEARRKQYVEDAEFSRGKLAVDQDPSIISKPRGPIAGIVAAAATRHGVAPAIALGIAQIESHLDPNAKAGTSSAGGLFQFLDGTAAQYHLRNKFDAAANADAGARLTADNIAGLKRDLGRDPTPGEVYLAHFGGYGVGEKIAKAAPNTPTSEIFSPQAIAANRSILAGKTAGEVKDWADAKMAKAMHDAGAGENPDWYKALSPEQRYVIDNEVDARRNQIAAQTRADIDVATTNAPSAILNTGQYTGNVPSQQQFYDAYGPQEGATRYDAFVASMQTNKQAYDMRTMSAADIQQMVNEAKPISSGDNAALEAARYKTLQDAQETIIKAREADPATYVRQAFPDVNLKWNNAQAQGNYQEPVAASINAQQQLGIKNIMPLPKEVAGNAVSVFKDEAQPQANRIGAVASIIMATPDPNQRQLLFNQLVDQGLPDITQGAFEALSRGDSAAAQRLFQAAMVDPAKLAGKIPGDIKPADIDQSVQEKIMDRGQVGDIYYGLSDGSADNYTRAQRDKKLIDNAVNIRLRNGETMDAAIAGVSKDLYGDVSVVNDTNLQILVPKDQDATAVTAGLTATLPDVRSAIEKILTPPTEAGDPVSVASQQYPVIKNLGVQSVTTPMPGDNRMLEFWPPGEPGDSQYPRPKELPLDKPGVQIISPDTKPSDVAADIVSHYMVNTDPKMKAMYQQFADTFKTPERQARLKQDYEWSKKNEGETRPMEQWAEMDRIPAYFRGYVFNQWPEKARQGMFNDNQRSILDQMGAYIQAGKGEAASSNAILSAAAKQKTDDIMANGYFRNSGDGYVFIDPKTALAVADQAGNPIIFKPKTLPPAPDNYVRPDIGIREGVGMGIQ